ncbi:MAG: zinc ribbon domain-containing protein [Oscillospiraceae bacterium]|nr:zinc ribbon domain-containing protein [Oscillospiraceae bacterium]
MFCKNCGKDIDIKSIACPYCGEDVDFLTGIDGKEKPYHLETFEDEINTAFNNRSSKKEVEQVEYEDISAYQTSRSTPEYDLDEEEKAYIPRRTSRKRRSRDTYDSDEREYNNSYEEQDDNDYSSDYDYDDYKSGNGWKLIAAVCCGVILICLIIIMAVSCGSGSSDSDPVATEPITTVPVVTTEATTEPTTTVPEKSVDEYLEDAYANDATAIETAQGFYSNLEKACADGDFDTFKTYFSSSYTEEEIRGFFDQYSATAATYTDFIPGYTNTVSCDKYIYVYIAATTNVTTGDYVENTFVLTSEGGAFKLDNKSVYCKEWMTKAPTLLT